MRVLVACEESQEVCKAFRALGHEAYSCDVLPPSGGHPEWHIKADVLPLLNGDCSFIALDGAAHTVTGKWDMLLAFPPCTHLSLSGAKHFAKKREDGRQADGIEFFARFFEADCEKIAIENPANIIMGGEYIKTYFPALAERYNLPRAASQKIQPWMFGDPYEKTTMLWLKGLPPLKETNVVEPEARHVTPSGKTLPGWYSASSKRMQGSRQSVRSKTFPGIARAMAEQFGGDIRRDNA